MKRTDEQVRRMRAGVREWVLDAGRAGSRAWRLAPTALLAALSACAFVPLVSGLIGIPGAAAEVLAGVGGNVLSEVLTDSLKRLRRRGDAPSREELGRELADAVERALTAGDVSARELRAEIADVLQEIGAAREAVEAAIAAGNRELQVELVDAFGQLGRDLAEFGFVLTDIRNATETILAGLDDLGAGHREQLDQLREQSLLLRSVLDRVVSVERRVAGPDPVTPAARAWPGCPYRGLLPFGQDDAEIFYGRERATHELAGVLAERLTDPGLVIVTGSSGVGKSSLLRAGLVPALTRGVLGRGSDRWRRLVITPTGAPLHELDTRLALLAGVDPSAERRTIAADPAEAHLRVRETVLSGAGDGRLVLIVDQFEELFARDTVGEDERAAFITALHAMAVTPCGPDAVPPALVVLSVRGDFLGECARYPQLLRALQEAQFVVGPMGEDDLRRAILGPAEVAGLGVEETLADTVLGDLRSSPASGGVEAGVLPLLSQAMMITWEHREDDRLTVRGYGASGGVQRAVQASAEAVYEALSAERKALAREVFQRLTSVDADGRLTRRRLTRADLPPEAGPVLDAFAAERLLVLGAGTVEIAHDALMRAWPRLRDWVEADRADLVLYGRLVDDATGWDEHGRDPSFLYQGARLAAVRDAVGRWDRRPGRYPELPRRAREFLGAAAHVAARRTRRRRLAVSGLVVLLVASLVATGAAVSSAREAAHERDVSVSEQLATQSETIGNNDPALSDLLAAAAWRIAPTEQARYSMLTAAARPARADLPGFTEWTDSVSAVAFSPTGRTFATVSENGTIRLWDTSTHRELGGPLRGSPVSSPHAIAFSPDGTILAAATDVELTFWDTRTHRRRFDTPLENRSVHTAVAFSPADKTLVAATGDGTVRWWDVRTHRRIGTAFTARDPLTGTPIDVVFGPQATTLAVTKDDGTAVWDLSRRRRIGVLPDHTSPSAAAFSPDGKIIAVAGHYDTTVRLWDLHAHHQASDTLRAGDIESMAFSPDGATLSVADGNATIRLWETATQREIGSPLITPGSDAPALAFSPDGAMLVTGGLHPRLWDLTPHRQIRPPLRVQHAALSALTAFAASPDGRLLATSDDRTLQLWNAATRRHVASMTVHANFNDVTFNGVAFSPDGRTLATSTEDGTAQIWNVTTHRQIGPSFGSRRMDWPVRTGIIAFSPGGKALAVVGAHETVRLWDVTTHRQIGAAIQAEGRSSIHNVHSIAFTPDGTALATAGQVVRLWNLRTHRQIGAPFTGHTDEIGDMVFSPDGHTLATAGTGDGTARLWNTATHRQIGAPLTIPQTSVDVVAFSPDGRTLATATQEGDGGSIRLWDVATHRQIGDPIHVSDDLIGWMVFSPDGRTLTTAGSRRERIRTWNVAEPDDPLAAVCADAARSLTPAEWARYVPAGEDFRPVCPKGER